MIRDIVRIDGGISRADRDALAEEEPLEIRVRGRAVSITMRTPDEHDAELATGFLFTEGIVRSADDIRAVEPCGRNEFGNLINVVLEPEVHVDFERLTRHVFASSSCGLCGKATIDAIRERFALIDPSIDFTVTSDQLARLPDAMRAAQRTFDQTGGLHAAALFSSTGELLVIREDVGRHNAVDKVIGHALLNRMLPLDRHVLLVSGRASFEIVQKALAARVSIIAAVSAPSSLAVEFADENNQTLIGFLRGRRMNVYTRAYRVQASPGQPVPEILTKTVSPAAGLSQ